MSAYVNSVKGAYIVVHASTIRYRKSLNFLKRYNIQTRLVFYDERYSILFSAAESRYIICYLFHDTEIVNSFLSDQCILSNVT